MSPITSLWIAGARASKIPTRPIKITHQAARIAHQAERIAHHRALAPLPDAGTPRRPLKTAHRQTKIPHPAKNASHQLLKIVLNRRGLGSKLRILMKIWSGRPEFTNKNAPSSMNSGRTPFNLSLALSSEQSRDTQAQSGHCCRLWNCLSFQLPSHLGTGPSYE